VIGSGTVSSGETIGPGGIEVATRNGPECAGYLISIATADRGEAGVCLDRVQFAAADGGGESVRLNDVVVATADD
jgi:hypothetical protein